jgi:hypothetical protein
MSLNHYQQHQLHRIETGLLRSDPQLAAMLGIFGKLSAGQAMPAREQMPCRQRSIRQAVALTVTATIVAAEAIVLLFRAVLALVISGQAAVSFSSSDRWSSLRESGRVSRSQGD